MINLSKHSAPTRSGQLEVEAEIGTQEAIPCPFQILDP